jgi:hypothetical protein
MKQRITALTLMACALALLCAGPVAADNGCHYLEVWLDAGADYKFKSMGCEKGSYKKIGSYTYMLHQKPSERIECNFIIGHVASGSTGGFDELNEVRVTQNLCFAKAGNIHVRQVSGRPPIYQSHEGSFGRQRPGKVKIIGFAGNPPPPDWLPELPQ